MAERARILDILGADVRVRPGCRAALPPERAPTSSSPRRAGAPTSRCSPRPPRPASRCGARSSSPGGCGRARARRRGSPSPAPTARPPRCRCSPRSCGPPGCAPCSAGNVGTPVLEAVLDPEPYDVIAVELSSFQLHWSHSLAPRRVAPCLNVAPDHVDWHGSLDEYPAAKGKVYANTEVACIYNVQDERTRAARRGRRGAEGCRAVGFTLGTPAPSQLGVVDDVLADRAFVEQRRTAAAELATLRRPARRRAEPGAAPRRQRPGGGRPGPRPRRAGRRRARRAARLRARAAPHRRGRHRRRRRAGSTTPRPPTRTPPRASLAAFEHVVWVAGGLLKGADVDEPRGRRRRRGCAASCSSAATAPRSPRHSPDTRRMSRSSTSTAPTLEPWTWS